MNTTTAATMAALTALIQYTTVLETLPADQDAWDVYREVSALQGQLSIPELEDLANLGRGHASVIRARAEAMKGRRGVRKLRRAAVEADRFSSGCTDQAYFWWAFAGIEERKRRLVPAKDAPTAPPVSRQQASTRRNTSSRR